MNEPQIPNATEQSAPPPIERTAFDYLLNAFEQATQMDNPAEHGYAAKRRALFSYVRDLERLCKDVHLL
jgi:hypothetical protein